MELRIITRSKQCTFRRVRNVRNVGCSLHHKHIHISTIKIPECESYVFCVAIPSSGRDRLGDPSTSDSCALVRPLTDNARRLFGLSLSSNFYHKFTEAYNIPVLGNYHSVSYWIELDRRPFSAHLRFFTT